MPAFYLPGAAPYGLTWPGLRTGDLPYAVFNNEAVLTNEASMAVGLDAGGIAAVSGLQAVSIEIFLSGTVGSASFSVQTADSPVDAAFQLEPSGVINAFTNGYARLELQPIKAKYIRILCTTAPSTGNVTAKISR
jgi:hypothetical protein